MRHTIKFDFHFPGIGGKLIQTWSVTATHVYTEYPTYDLEGDPTNLPDFEEYLEDIQISEMTGGKFLGYVLLSDIGVPAMVFEKNELRDRIIEQAQEVGRQQLKEFFKPILNS